VHLRHPQTSIGAFTFAKCFLSDTLDSKKTLIFTGATMSVRGSAGFGTMAPSKFALRALSQVREHGVVAFCHNPYQRGVLL
jgi:hypothetical protein